VPHAPLDYAVYAGMLAILLGAAWLSYLLFESNTFRMRRAVKNALRPRPQRTDGIVVDEATLSQQRNRSAPRP
jgi:hypothetical protein